MDKTQVIRRMDERWAVWRAVLDGLPESRTREPGVAGEWTVHDIVNHVNAYARFHLVQARGALTGFVPEERDWLGPRKSMEGDDGTLDGRNEAIRRAGLPLTWQQVLDEDTWLRTETIKWAESRSRAELEEVIGWVPHWDPNYVRGEDDSESLIVRRVMDVPAVVGAVPVREFIDPDEHRIEHLEQIRAWLGASETSETAGR